MGLIQFTNRIKMTKFKHKDSKFYPIEDDWNQLSDKYREKIPSGVRIYGEKVDRVYNVTDWIEDGLSLIHI